MVSGGLDGQLVEWDLTNGLTPRVRAQSVGNVNALTTVVSPGGQTLLVSAGESLRIWDLATWKQLARLETRELSGVAATVSPTGECLAVTVGHHFGDSEARVIDLHTTERAPAAESA